MCLSVASLLPSVREPGARWCYLGSSDGHVCTPLCQWIPHLYGKLKIEYTTDTNASAMLRPARFDALVLTLQSSAGWKCFEAIDLVLLAAQLDPVHTWEVIIRIGCYTRSYLPELITPTEVTPRLRLVPRSEEVLVKWLRWLRWPWLRSPSYRLTRKWLLKEHRGARRSSDDPSPRIPVTVEWDFQLSRRQMANQVSRLLSTAQVGQTRYQLEEVNFNDLDFDVASLEKRRLLQHESYELTDIHDCRISQVHLLQLQDAGVRIQFSSKQGWWAYRTKTFVRGDVANPAEVIKIQGDARCISDEWWFLLREGGGVKEVHLKLCDPRQSMRHQYRAIAAALLDSRSPTSVEHVYLCSSIDNESFRDLLGVLQSDDPFEQLGWGQLTASRYRPTARRHLRSLSLELHESFKQDDAPLFDLLRIVSFSLESLAIKFQNDSIRLDEDDLAMLFTACPKLQCLSLHNVSLTSLDLIASVYNAGLCSSLASLIHDGSVEDMSSVASLFEACNDPSQQVHHTLRDVELTHKTNNGYGEQALHRIFDAIRCNRTLRHIALDLQQDLYTARQRDELFRISQTSVLVHSGRLPLVQKLAFLSAVGSRLDQDACRRVLEFTSAMEPRRIMCGAGRKPLDWS